MRLSPTRRSVLAGAACLLPALSARAEPSRAIATIEGRIGGRVGVAALDTGNGKRIEHRANERFPMCSTFKLLASAAVLHRVDQGKEQLDRRVRYSQSELLAHAPISEQHVQTGMTVGELCAAAVEYSDNTAANLLLASLGGPAGFTHFARALGDNVTRLDRNELSLNTAIPGDPRDTTSPGAMLADMRAVLLGNVLTPPSRKTLQDWLIANTTGAAKIRAGIPPAWRIGDKTGNGANGASNDLAIIWPPERAPILVAVYCMGSSASSDALNQAIAEVGRLVAETI
jgi:beta-lactamase class A